MRIPLGIAKVIPVYEIDSIFGNRLATFNLKVYELSYFLSSLDPMDNFERNKLYWDTMSVKHLRIHAFGSLHKKLC